MTEQKTANRTPKTENEINETRWPPFRLTRAFPAKWLVLPAVYTMGLLVAVVVLPVTIRMQPLGALGLFALLLGAWIWSMGARAVVLHRLWNAIQPGRVSATPGEAVGYCFVPGVNVAWIPHIHLALLRDVGRMREVAVRRDPERGAAFPAWSKVDGLLVSGLACFQPVVMLVVGLNTETLFSARWALGAEQLALLGLCVVFLVWQLLVYVRLNRLLDFFAAETAVRQVARIGSREVPGSRWRNPPVPLRRFRWVGVAVPLGVWALCEGVGIPGQVQRLLGLGGSLSVAAERLTGSDWFTGVYLSATVWSVVAWLLLLARGWAVARAEDRFARFAPDMAVLGHLVPVYQVQHFFAAGPGLARALNRVDAAAGVAGRLPVALWMALCVVMLLHLGLTLMSVGGFLVVLLFTLAVSVSLASVPPVDAAAADQVIGMAGNDRVFAEMMGLAPTRQDLMLELGYAMLCVLTVVIALWIARRLCARIRVGCGGGGSF